MLKPCSNAQLPKKRVRRAPKVTVKTKYPFPTMQVGEFFFLPYRSTNNMMSYASAVGRQMGKKFSTRLCTMMEQIDANWIEVPADHPHAILGIWIGRSK